MLFRSVKVETLFPVDCGQRQSDYHACNQRVCALLKFRLFVYRSDCPQVAFWRDRMIQANPRGAVHRMSRPNCSASLRGDAGMQQASDICTALTSILPRHRERFKKNLEVEVERWRLRQFGPRNFVSGDFHDANAIALTEMKQRRSFFQNVRANHQITNREGFVVR